jgi:cytosine/adenosine deaminase-related metal-dependent hydrolase
MTAPLPVMKPKPCPSFSGRIAAAALALLFFNPFALLNAAEAIPKLIVTNAIIVPLDWSDKEPYRGYMVIGPDGRIAALGEGDAPASSAPVLDVGGKIVMPGFLSVHSHLSGGLARGTGANLWITEKRVSGAGRNNTIQDGDTYSTVLHGALDFLLGGVTTVYNYSSMARNSTHAQYLETLYAEIDAGSHFVFGYSIGEQSDLYTNEQRIENVRSFIGLTKTIPGRELMLKISVASIAMRWTEEESKFEFEVLKMFPEFGMDMEMHYLEPPPNVPRTIYERSNFAWLKKYGVLGPNITFAHFIHPTDEILKESAAAGATMSWNPLSNGRLASGLTDVPRYRKLGITVGMGLDGMGTADIADPFQNMRIGLYGLRFRDQNPNVMSPREILHLHTLESAKAMRVAKDVGSLEVGKYADFLVVDPNDPSTGPLYNVYATLVFACSRANINDVYVAGQPVIKDRTFVHHDLRQIQKDARYRMQRKTTRLPAPALSP